MTADKVVITRNGKDVTFIKAGGNWKMKEPVEADAEDEALRELHDALARLRAEEIVAEKPADLKPYGLDKPERWRVFNGDKEVLNLLVGAREKVGEPGKQKDGFRSYAKLDKGDLVVLLDMALTAKLVGRVSQAGPVGAARRGPGDQDRGRHAGGPRLVQADEGPARLDGPAEPGERMSTETVTDFLDAFAGLKAERFIEHDAKAASSMAWIRRGRP